MRRKNIGERHSHSHSHTSHSIDYYTYISGIKKWNTSFKVIFSLSGIFTVIFADSIPVSFFTVLFMGFITVFKGRVSLGEYIRLLKIPLVFIALSTIAIALQISTEEGEYLTLPFIGGLNFKVLKWYFYISQSSGIFALNVGIKAFGAISAMYMLTLSTPIGEIIGVFRRIHIPMIILELMYLIYRYIFMMTDVYNKQKDAALSRLGYVDYKTSLCTFAGNLSNLLVMSLKRASACYDAMESRGYEGNMIFLENQYNFNIVQALYMVLYFIAVAIILISRFVL